jgi:hypothetical protein
VDFSSQRPRVTRGLATGFLFSAVLVLLLTVATMAGAQRLGLPWSAWPVAMAVVLVSMALPVFALSYVIAGHREPVAASVLGACAVGACLVAAGLVREVLTGATPSQPSVFEWTFRATHEMTAATYVLLATLCLALAVYLFRLVRTSTPWRPTSALLFAIASAAFLLLAALTLGRPAPDLGNYLPALIVIAFVLTVPAIAAMALTGALVTFGFLIAGFGSADAPAKRTSSGPELS